MATCRTFSIARKHTSDRKQRVREARSQQVRAQDQAQQRAEAQRWARVEEQKQAIRAWFRQQQWFPVGHPLLARMLRAIEQHARSEAADRNIIESARNFLVFNQKLRENGTVAREAPYRTRCGLDPFGVRFDAREALRRAAWTQAHFAADGYRRNAMLAERALLPGKDITVYEKLHGRTAVLKIFDEWLRKNPERDADPDES